MDLLVDFPAQERGLLPLLTLAERVDSLSVGLWTSPQ